jgi:predicted dehydrogenase
VSALLPRPAGRLALETVRAGGLGEVVAVDILRGSLYPPYAGGPLPPQYRTAGYPFRDLGIHGLYVIEAFLGPIEKVDATFREGGGDGNLVYNDWRAVARCARGLGQIQLSFGVRPLQHQIIIQGTKGVLRLDLFLMFQAKRKACRYPSPPSASSTRSRIRSSRSSTCPATSWPSRASRSASTTGCRSS